MPIASFSQHEMDGTTKDHDVLHHKLERSSDYEAYHRVYAINNRRSSLEISTRNAYLYQLDRAVGFTPKLEPQGDEITSTVDYRYNELAFKDIAFIKYCAGPNCTPTATGYVTLTYNEDDQLLTQQTGWWNGTDYVYDCDIPVERTYEYNDDGNLVRFVTASSFDEYNYNDDDLLFHRAGYVIYPNRDTFTNGHNNYYYHNAAGQLTSIGGYNYRLNEDAFIRYDSLVFLYNQDGLLSEEQFYIGRRDEDNPWELNEVTTYHYRNDGSLDYSEYYDLYDETLADPWRKKERTVYNYHPEGSLTHISYYDIRDENNLVEFFRSSYTYDRNISADEILVHRREQGRMPIGDHMLLKENHFFVDPYDFADFGPNPSTTDYEYVPFGTSDTEDLDISSQVALFPNPAHDFIRFNSHLPIDGARMAIYDAEGRLHKELVLSGDRRIDISRLIAGVYMFQLLIDGQVASGKFVKQ